MLNKKLSIIIVSWNVQKLLEKCLISIFANTKNLDFEVIVIDNNSSDNTVKTVLEKFSQVVLIQNKKNLGFAKANNQGIEKSNGKFILFLNPDTQILHKSFEKMVNFFQEKKDAGIVGCKLSNTDKSLQESVRNFPKLSDQLLISFSLHRIFPFLIKKYLQKNFDYSKTQAVEQVMGACFLTSKKIIDKIGNFDEKFFVWFEEVDFCRRVWDNQLKVYYFADAEIIHHGGQSFQQIATFAKKKMYLKSLCYYFWKHKKYFSFLVILVLSPVSILLAWVYLLARQSPLRRDSDGA